MLRSLERKWIKQGKTKDQIRKLRYYYRNKEKLLNERRSLHWAGNGRSTY